MGWQPHLVKTLQATETTATKQAGESFQGDRQPTSILTMKAVTRVGTWNVQTTFETGKAARVARETKKYNIQLLGICESRLNGVV